MGWLPFRRAWGPPDEADADLWRLLNGLLQQLRSDRFLVRHTPSHLDVDKTEAPFEDWLARHNGHADLLAGIAARNRPQALIDHHAAAMAYHRDVLHILRSLRTIFFGIANLQNQTRSSRVSDADDMWDPQVPLPSTAPRQVDLDEVVPLNWRTQLVGHSNALPLDFVTSLCEFLFDQDAQASEAFHVSWLELVFMLHLGTNIRYPVCKRRWTMGFGQHCSFSASRPNCGGSSSVDTTGSSPDTARPGTTVDFCSGH